MVSPGKVFANTGQAFARIGWKRTAIAAALGLAGGYLAFATAVAGAMRTRNPPLALMFDSGEGIALAKQADLLFLTNPQQPPAATKALAMQALRAQATDARALRLLGYVEARGDVASPSAERLVRLAARLTRREPGAQLWLIQNAASKSDYGLAIGHVDTLLRTKPATQDTLFPIMVRGLADPKFRALFRRYRQDAPAWVGDFLSYAIANTPKVELVVTAVEEARGFPAGPKAPAYAKQLMERLAKEGKFDPLRRIFLLMPGADPERLQRAEFSRTDVAQSDGVAGWQAFDGPDAGASILLEKGRKDPILSAYVNSGTTRQVASKLLYLRPGAYLVSTQVDEIETAEGGNLKWQLRCPTRAGGAVAWTSSLPLGATRATMTVPADCPVQFLDLVASGGDSQSGLEAIIGRFALRTVK